MANKKFWLGMLVLVLTFGMLVGCTAAPGEVTITNGSQFRIKQVVFTTGNTVVKSDPLGIEPGKSKTYEFADFSGNVTVTVTVNSEDVDLKRSASVSEYTGGVPGISGSIEKLTLSGTTKETLRLD